VALQLIRVDLGTIQVVLELIEVQLELIQVELVALELVLEMVVVEVVFTLEFGFYLVVLLVVVSPTLERVFPVIIFDTKGTF